MKPNRWKEEEYGGGWFSHPCPWWFSVNGYHGKCELTGRKEHFSCHRDCKKPFQEEGKKFRVRSEIIGQTKN